MSGGSRRPHQPDAAQPAGADPTDPLDALLLEIGRLNYVWTNTESLMIHLIGGLGRMDKDVAMVVFLTLPTTRSRLDLVERLAKMPQTPPDQRTTILSLTRRFQKEAPLRNKYNHCIYSFDPTSGSISTILMRIADRRDDLRIGKSQPADTAARAELGAAISRIQKLNLDIWRSILNFGYPA